jgi:hypothetical protein
VQLVVLISIIILNPISFLVSKATVSEEESHHVENTDIDAEMFEKVEWKSDINNPKAFKYLDEYVIRPFLIRSYHYRKKYMKVINLVFESSATLYEHSHGQDDHGHHDEHHDHPSDLDEDKHNYHDNHDDYDDLHDSDDEYNDDHDDKSVTDLEL